MGRLAGFSGREVRRVAEGDGWEFRRQVGSHMVLRKDGVSRGLSIPDHGTLDEGMLRSLIRTMDWTVEDFLRARAK